MPCAFARPPAVPAKCMSGSLPNAPELTRRRFVAGSCLLAAGLSSTKAAASTTSHDQEAPIETKVEELVTESLAEHGIPGATVAVVNNGETALVEGYGVADRETGGAVTAQTPFRIGSVSKPVVWTAIARRAATGELDLEAPVSQYLDEDLRSWDEPVTLAQLATHTGGFEPTNLGLWYPSPAAVDPLPELLNWAMPSQVRSPGTLGSYSNHGVALAGQALASTVDDPFPDAIEAVLFEPAGMDRSSFHQPLPDHIRDPHATGHDSDQLDGPFAGVGMAPAGGLSTTAADMARFLQLHLNTGAVDGEQVLRPETVALLQRQWFTHHEALSGMALGLAERSYGDCRVLSHNGATLSFTSHVLLVPELDFGVFLAFNSERGRAVLEDLPDEILDELLGSPSPDGPEPTGRPARAGELAGTYRTVRVPETTHDAFPSLLGATSVDVSVANDGALLVAIDGDQQRWIEREPLVFQHEETGRTLAFDETDGEITHLYVGGVPSAFATLEWHESLTFHSAVLLASLLCLVAGLWWSPSREEGESRRAWLASVRTEPDRLATLAAFGGSLAFLAFVVITVGYFLFATIEFLSEPSPLYRIAFVLPVGGAVASVAALAAGAQVWRRRDWPIHRWIHYTAVTASLLAMTGFLWYWNLLLPP